MTHNHVFSVEEIDGIVNDPIILQSRPLLEREADCGCRNEESFRIREEIRKRGMFIIPFFISIILTGERNPIGNSFGLCYY